MSNKSTTKEQRIENLIKAFHENELAMKPFKEFRSDLKKSYVENNWLSKSEVSAAIKVYRFLKSDADYDQFHSIYIEMEKKFGQ